MKIGGSYKFEQGVCTSCAKPLDGVTGVGNAADLLPSPGDLTMCMYCGHIMVFADDLALRNPSAKEAHDLAGDPHILAIQRARAAMGIKA